MTNQLIARTGRLVVAGVAIGVVAVFSVFMGPPHSTVQAQSLGQTAIRTIDREPLIIMDISGYGIAGNMFHRHLTVYSDGLTSFANTLGFEPGTVSASFVSPGRALRLHRALLGLGALNGRDLWQSVADMPLTTITVFGPAQDPTGSNTYSFYVPMGGDVLILEELEAFVQEAHPDPKLP